MHQTSLLDLPVTFGGSTFSESEDGPRPRKHLAKVKELLSDGKPRTAEEIAAVVGCKEAAAGARARDLRKAPWHYDVRCERVQGGVWTYRMVTHG